MGARRSWAGGRRGAAGGLARLLQGWKRMSFQNTSTKETNHEVGRTGHDFTQLFVIRRRTKRQRSGARVEGAPFGEGSHPIRHGDGLRMLCDGHGCWRRDRTHALAIRPTNGRLVFLAKRFETSNSSRSARKDLDKSTAESLQLLRFDLPLRLFACLLNPHRKTIEGTGIEEDFTH
jgi:hypothetical protein